MQMEVQKSDSTEDGRHELPQKPKLLSSLETWYAQRLVEIYTVEETNTKSTQHLRLWYTEDLGSGTPRAPEGG